MNYQSKTKDELIEELQILKKKYNSLKRSYKRDIFEYEQAQKRLQESEKKYSALINKANTSIHVIQDGLIKFVNAKTISLLERSDEQEFIGKPFLEFVYNDDRSRVSENYRHRLADKSIPETFTCRIVTPSGVAKWVEVQITYISWEGKPAHMNFLNDITDRKSSEEELLNMKESLENLTKHLDDIRENERVQISREFHDEFSQTLTVFKIDLKWLLSKVVRGSEEEAKLQEMLKLVNTNEDVVHRITSELRSPIMDDLGLAASLEWYCNGFEKRSGLQINMELDEVQSENTNNNLVIYRVLQESLTNVVRHADAKKIRVKLIKKGNNIVLTVQDDGIGISNEKIKSPKSLGLIGMNERVRQTGGHMEITTPNKGGTKIIAYIPE